jgi:4-hydroxy-tetrahydrodipicolinate synthase
MLNLYTAITIPFTNENNIDYESLIQHVNYLLNNNTGIVLFGTTGETSTLKYDEKIEIMTKLLDFYPDLIDKTIIGVGGNDTSECIKFSKLCASYKFYNIMITTPYYNKPTQEGLYQHFTQIAQEHETSLLPRYKSQVVLYNVPTRCITNILPSTILRICNKCSNVVAVKEASGNLSQVINIRTIIPSLKVFSGDDALLIPIMSVGGHGVISVTSNIIPKQIHNIINECLLSNYENAFKLYSNIHKFTELMFVETNPIPIKYALSYLSFYKYSYLRLPLVELTDSHQISKINTELDLLDDLYDIRNQKKLYYCDIKKIIDDSVTDNCDNIV